MPYWLNESYLQLGQVLQFGQVRELEIERVDAQEAEDVEDVEEEPGNEHYDVVREDHVVDNEGKHPGHNFPGGEDAHGEQPAFEGRFLLLS